MNDLISATPAEQSASKTRWWQIVVWVVVLGLLGLVAFQMRRNGLLTTHLLRNL